MDLCDCLLGADGFFVQGVQPPQTSIIPFWGQNESRTVPTLKIDMPFRFIEFIDKYWWRYIWYTKDYTYMYARSTRTTMIVSIIVLIYIYILGLIIIISTDVCRIYNLIARKHEDDKTPAFTVIDKDHIRSFILSHAAAESWMIQWSYASEFLLLLLQADPAPSRTERLERPERTDRCSERLDWLDRSDRSDRNERLPDTLSVSKCSEFASIPSRLKVALENSKDCKAFWLAEQVAPSLADLWQSVMIVQSYPLFLWFLCSNHSMIEVVGGHLGLGNGQKVYLCSFSTVSHLVLLCPLTSFNL